MYTWTERIRRKAEEDRDMIIETKKGAKIELTAKDGKVHAMHNGNDMGAVAEMANKDLGWHLRAGTVALAVADKYVAATKQLIAATKARAISPELAKSVADLNADLDHSAAVKRMSARGFA